MNGKAENELGTFLQSFIYNKARKNMWHRKQVYWGCYAGEDERKISCDNFTATYKGDTEQTCRENKTGKIYNDQIKTLMQFYFKMAPHTQTHTQTKINPDVWQRTFCSQRGR